LRRCGKRALIPADRDTHSTAITASRAAIGFDEVNMIKTLFFIMALLLPGLSYARNPDARFWGQVVPADPPSGIKCDYGPSYSGSVPAPAAAAGFTTCALNGDFSKSFFSKISSWLNPCGGARKKWEFYWEYSIGANDGDCSRVGMKTDSTIGKRVLHLQEQPNDPTAANQQTWALDWPGRGWAVAHDILLPVYGYYAEITFRFTPASVGEGGAPAGPLGWWMNQWVNGCCWVENDFIEGYDGTKGPGGQVGWAYGSAHYFARWIHFAFDITKYHTLSALVTSDGSTAVAKCMWLDGAAQGCTTVPVADSSYCASDATCVHDVFPQHGGFITVWVGQGSHNRGPRNVDMFVQSERVWTCAGYRSASNYCFGSLMTSQ
jgi:hypothetical protein